MIGIRRFFGSSLFWIVAGCLLAGLVSLFSFRSSLHPLWFFVSWALVFFLVFRISAKKYQYIFFNIGAILIIVGGFEAFFLIKDRSARQNKRQERLEGVYDCVRDDTLGVRMIPGSRRVASKWVGDERIYEVIITADTFGWRITPTSSSEVNSAILFFGDSFTFGEGVNDEETLPWLVGLASRDKYQVYNFALHGYGPHQMLALLESGWVEKTVSHKVKKVLFQTLYPDHVFRLAGYLDWGLLGPRYVLDDEGKPLRMGNINDYSTKQACIQWVKRSALGFKVLEYLRYSRHRDRELYVAVMLRSYELLRQLNPDLEFHMIIWDWTEGQDAKYFKRLSDAGILLHDVNHILPGGDKSNLAYKISPMDKHPNPACHRLFAAYILKNIINSE